ncbi:MAG: PLP-dependent aminotransferase family protein [Megasphaera cerevisiae]|jgi:2-aminoadipate transaminase|nr:PLP-dependent aminotransferase family protein [Megasphaera cerevisiae]
MKYADRIEMLRPSAIRAAGALINSQPECITFAQGYPSPEVMPLQEIVGITSDLVTHQGKTTLQYGETKGNRRLIESICACMEKKDIACTAENIQITTGSQQAIYLTGLLALNKEDVVIVENPTYLGALSAYVPNECRFVGVDADDDGMIMDCLEAVLQREKKAKLIYVVPNFSNPTGKTWSAERRRALYDIAEKYDLLIAEDDPYGDIRFEGEAVPAVKTFDKSGRVIYMGSFSKVFFAGIRVGYTISSKKIADYFEFLKQGIDLQSNEFAQYQVAEYLQRYDLNEHIQKIARNYKEKRDLMARIIDEKFPSCIKRTNPHGGMFVWIELPEEFDADALLEACVKEWKVGYVPGGPFYAAGMPNNGIRLNFSTVSLRDIEEGMNRLAVYLSGIMDTK